MSEEFKVDIKQTEPGIAVLVVHGYLDAHTFEQMDNTINTLYEQKAFKLVVDLSHVPYISSAGAGVFIGAVGTAQDNSGNIVMVNPQPNVREVFDLLGLTQIFLFANDTPAALKLLRE